jgi:hypothetical protein
VAETHATNAKVVFPSMVIADEVMATNAESITIQTLDQ